MDILAIEPLRRRLTDAFDAGPERTAPARIELTLRQILRAGGLVLPEPYLRPSSDGYARRLLFLDPLLRFSVLALTWGPGQGTPLHDHDEHWGVECVAVGRMEAEAFRLLGVAPDGRVRLESLGTKLDGPGSGGVIQPPHEYHVLRNPDPEATSVTIHVYSGELTRFRVFHPTGEGWYRPELKTVTYTENL